MFVHGNVDGLIDALLEGGSIVWHTFRINILPRVSEEYFHHISLSCARCLRHVKGNDMQRLYFQQRLRQRACYRLIVEYRATGSGYLVRSSLEGSWCRGAR